MLPLLTLTLTLAAPIPPDAKRPRESLEGVWVLKYREVGGRGRSQGPFLKAKDAVTLSTDTLVVVGSQYAFRTHAGDMKLDPTKKTLELKVTSDRYKGETIAGVFERTGDTLKLVLPTTPLVRGPAPTELKPAAQQELCTFERVKTVTPEGAAELLKQRVAALARNTDVAGKGRGFGRSGLAPALPAPPTPAEKLQQALDRIEKLEKRLEELERQKK